MITEDYVSFETAKLLVKKGFEFNAEYESYYTLEGVIVYFKDNTQDINIAPRITLQMAMKWLREVHKLDIDVSIEYKNSKKVYYYSILKKTVIRNIDCLYSETNFDSYEQAAKAAIKYCLENLI